MTAPVPSPSTSLTLGAQLQRNLTLGHEVFNPRDPQFTADHERLAVERFFEDAKALISLAISKGLLPPPIELGSSGNWSSSAVAHRALDGYSWAHKKILPSTQKYFPLWDAFAQWADSQDLMVCFEDAHDGVGVHSWLELRVSPNKLRLPFADEQTGAEVVVSKDRIQQFGSAQAYLEHLERQAGVH